MSETIEFIRTNLEFPLELLVVEFLFMKKYERSSHFVWRLLATLVMFSVVSVSLSTGLFSFFWAHSGSCSIFS